MSVKIHASLYRIRESLISVSPHTCGVKFVRKNYIKIHKTSSKECICEPKIFPQGTISVLYAAYTEPNYGGTIQYNSPHSWGSHLRRKDFPPKVILIFCATAISSHSPTHDLCFHTQFLNSQ